MAGVTLQIDGARWRQHLSTVAKATPGVVPVAKGNGYGFGLARLAEEAEALGVDTIAVGVVSEVAVVRPGFSGDVVILNPYEDSSDLAVSLTQDERVITTVSRMADLSAIATQPGRPRVLVEVRTSMRRHGLAVEELVAVRDILDDVRFEGWSIHLPLLTEGRYAEAERLGRVALDAVPGTLWLSHLPAEEAVALGRQLGGAGAEPAPVRLRVGTRLWLGDPSSRTSTATVLDVHRVSRGDRVGYRQRKSAADGWVVVVAGGTAHGIGLEAPTAASSLRQRAVAVANGSLTAIGRALSPYTIAGKKRWFVEPPHMQSSLIFLPHSATPPAIGAEVPVELRMTTAAIDTYKIN